jgi:hypothetical protein
LYDNKLTVIIAFFLHFEISFSEYPGKVITFFRNQADIVFFIDNLHTILSDLSDLFTLKELSATVNRRYAAQGSYIIPSCYKDIAAMRLYVQQRNRFAFLEGCNPDFPINLSCEVFEGHSPDFFVGNKHQNDILGA